MYRDKIIPYQEPTDPDLKSMRVFFQHRAPGEWNRDITCLDLFKQVYGQPAYDVLIDRSLVPENIDPVWVGGTFWQDPNRRIRPVYGGLVADTTWKPGDPVPEGYEVSHTPFGDKIVPIVRAKVGDCINMSLNEFKNLLAKS